MATRPLPIYPTDRDFYEALSRRENRAYTHLYANLYPSFQHWVTTNSGTEQDAEDAFNTGILSFLLNVETGKYQFQENARITTVAFDYCKRVWQTELKSARFRRQSTWPDDFDAVDTTDIEKDLERIDIVEAVRQSLHQLKGECQKVIEWFYVDDLPLREIAERLGMKETSVKSKRYDCTEKLKTFYQQIASKRGL